MGHNCEVRSTSYHGGGSLEVKYRGSAVVTGHKKMWKYMIDCYRCVVHTFNAQIFGSLFHYCAVTFGGYDITVFCSALLLLWPFRWPRL